jgi:tRNA pseudouridine55 synthase
MPEYPLITPSNFDLEQIRLASVLCFDKPRNWSSFKLVKQVRFFTKAKRVGHAGTLDPLAAGLLIICTGSSTKQISGIQDEDKEYTGEFTLGSTTPSYDLETEPENFSDISHINMQMLKETAAGLTGEINQKPPAFSAVKVAGTRAYKLARQGLEPDIKMRTTQIHEFEIVSFEEDRVRFRVVCSKGTYIRSLADDFGRILGVGAHLSDLVRTRTGSFKLEDAFSTDEFKTLCGF